MYFLSRHGRARPGHPRLFARNVKKDVDARHKAGHDDTIDNKGAESVAQFRPWFVSRGSQRSSAEQATGLNLDARPHGGGNRHALDVGALGAGGLRLGDRIRERLDVLHKLLFRERRLADAGLHDAGLLDAEFDRTALGALYRTRDVHGAGANLRIGHHAARSQHLTEPADQRHHVGVRDTAVEIDLTALHLLDQVLRANHVGTRRLGLFGLGATRKHADAQGAAGAVRQRHHAAHHLIGMARVDAEIHRNLDGLVEFRLGAFLDHLDGVRERIKLLAINALAGLLQTFSNCHDRYPATSTPIERAEPSTIFMAASMVSQFRSFIFASAISRTCALVTAPALSRPGSFEPDVSLAAFLMKKDIGGVRSSKVNERSA